MRTEDLHAPFQIGRTRFKTPEGFLVCRDVAIGRTGDMIYLPSQLELQDGSKPAAGPDGLVVAERTADEAFHPTALASFEGKPVTINHPPVTVTPENWRNYAVGSLQKVRRGEGADSDLLLADLLVTDASAIKGIQAGKLQVSCGYDADYTQLSPGRVKQSNIVGNHLALVERGRAGPRCAIGDEHVTEIVPKPKTWIERVKDAAFGTKDVAVFDALMSDVTVKEPIAPTTVPVTTDASALDAALTRALAPVMAKVAALEKIVTKDDAETEDEKKARLKREKEKEEADKEKPTTDAAALASSAEILAPGFKLPTTDAASADAVAIAQRAVLTQALTTKEGQAAITPFLRGRDLAKLGTQDVDLVFTGAAELRRTVNNTTTAGGVRPGVTTRDFGRVASSPADINKANADYWSKRSTQAI